MHESPRDAVAFGSPIVKNIALGQPEERRSAGIAGLDDVLNGGLPRSHLYLVEGDPGTGKTTLALQFLLEDVKSGDKGMYPIRIQARAGGGGPFP